ncbi:hypothetical protein Aconfl_12690 [Algoriphagus confluentis]|uniref:Uncharacterized protein n=1 Tax=Algoriphagus confluentis TaxID=1697556 RepID=A0ABQ6PKX2_9BACT|nr:hypothetical protein Aconfl_12690 [Algoriphagus confluentis]
MTGHSPLSGIIVPLSGVEWSSYFPTPVGKVLGLTKFAAYKINPSLVAPERGESRSRNDAKFASNRLRTAQLSLLRCSG